MLRFTQLRPHALCAALLLTAIGRSALAATDIISCQTIFEPGSYRVTRNLTPTVVGANCLDIQVSDVTIDLQGHVLTGNGGGAGISVPNAFLGGNVVVRNGTIRFFREGIKFAGNIDGIRIENMQVHNNASVGIFAASNAIVSGNMVRNNGTGILIRPNFGFAGNGSLIVNNTAIGNASGINVEVKGSTVAGNVVQRNLSGDGLAVTCPINLHGNTTSANLVNLRLRGSGCLNLNNLVGP
jgi:hypothetical protein